MAFMGSIYLLSLALYLVSVGVIGVYGVVQNDIQADLHPDEILRDHLAQLKTLLQTNNIDDIDIENDDLRTLIDGLYDASGSLSKRFGPYEFSYVRGKKMAPLGFVGSRGRRMNAGDFFGARGKRIPSNDFFGARGRRQPSADEFVMARGERTPPSGFFGARGKKAAPSGFVSSRGKKSDFGRLENMDMERDLRNSMQYYMQLRNTRAVHFADDNMDVESKRGPPHGFQASRG